jgi:hypothetical protein
MTEYSQQTPESEFNMGIAHLKRINYILDAIAENSLMLFEEHNTKKGMQNWFYLLSILNKEIDFLYDNGEIKESTNSFNKTSKSINEWTKNSTLENFELAYNEIIVLERWLKKQLVKRKMMMKFGKDKTKAIIDL